MHLNDVVAVLKEELGLSGNLKEVIEQAAFQLNIDSAGKPLPEVGQACMRMLGKIPS